MTATAEFKRLWFLKAVNTFFFAFFFFLFTQKGGCHNSMYGTIACT